MPVVAATDLPASQPAQGVRFAASAPSELFWLLLYLAHGAIRERRSVRREELLSADALESAFLPAAQA